MAIIKKIPLLIILGLFVFVFCATNKKRFLIDVDLIKKDLPYSPDILALDRLKYNPDPQESITEMASYKTAFLVNDSLMLDFNLTTDIGKYFEQHAISKLGVSYDKVHILRLFEQFGIPYSGQNRLISWNTIKSND